jgi:hypothetical protein
MKKINQIALIGALTAMSWSLMAQQTPAPKQTEAISIVGGTAHLGNGQVIQQATLVFENGQIIALGGPETPTKGQVISASGKHIYPGFITMGTSLGLIEVDAVKATDDQSDIGDMIPHVRSIIAYDAESKVVESMRPNGVLMSQVSPKGGMISGSSSVVQLDAWNWEDAAVKTDEGIHISWPNPIAQGRWWMGEDPGMKPNKNYPQQVDRLIQFIQEARAYHQGGSSSRNEPYEALKDLLSGIDVAYVEADSERQIIDAVSKLKSVGIQKIAILGGREAYKVIPMLLENQVSVITQATHQLPFDADADYDMPFKLPKILADSGLVVAMHNMNEANHQNRNLPFYAGQLIGQGMNPEEALRLITQNPAKIMGIDHLYGTLEVGKSATLFISQGDALDMRTNQIEHAFIDGRHISLDTHQTKLYQRYSGKYQQ